MRRNRLFWHLLPASLALALGGLAVAAALAALHFRHAAHAHAVADLEAEARRLARLAAPALAAGRAAAADSLCRALGRGLPVRLTLVRPDGRVAGDSEEYPAVMGNHADRPEIVAALAGRTGVARRASPTQSRPTLYVAVPVGDGGDPVAVTGVARAALPVAAVDVPLRTFGLRLWPLLALAAAGAVAAAALLARRLGGPLRELAAGADRLAGGDLSARVPHAGPDECAHVADALNRMAAALDARLRAMAREGREQQAVLYSMLEGVLAVDEEERVLKLNEAAARLLRVDAARAEGRPLQEVARNADLHRFVARVLASRTPQEGEFVLRDDVRESGERVIQAQGTVLRDEAGHAIGGLVVLNDVTRLRRLETVRREFVANVSHELRTPITAIKGFVETMVEAGAADPGENLRYLGIVQRQADRLDAIIEDLLTLSRLEQDEAGEAVVLSEEPLRRTLLAAAQAVEPFAAERGVPVEVACPDDLRARLNAPLLEQAVVNLVHNAVKYSEPGRPVVVSAVAAGGGAEIRVRDEGCGIAPEHLPRLFERFYRVDKGRSRRQGGTGLGLSIVKHIVRAHGGSVAVASEPGRGSAFTIALPGPGGPAGAR